MRINDYKAQLPILQQARVVPLVWGPHGIGKSSAYVGYYTVNLRLGNMEVGDIVGFPVERGDVMEFLPPDWWASLVSYCELNPEKTAVLHLDEINHIRKDMQSIIFQLVLDREVNGRRLPDNVQVVASANPPTEDYPGVFDFQNKALLDRFCHVTLTPSVDEWADWAKENGVSPSRVKFILKNPAFLEIQGARFDAVSLAQPSRRSQAAADRCEKLGASDEIMYGLIGIEAHEAYKSFKKDVDKERVKGVDVLSYKKATKDRVKELASSTEGYAELGVLIDDVAAELKARTDKLTKKEASALAAFVMDLPADLAMAAGLVFTDIKSSAMELDYDKQPELFAHFRKLFADGVIKPADPAQKSE